MRNGRRLSRQPVAPVLSPEGDSQARIPLALQGSVLPRPVHCRCKDSQEPTGALNTPQPMDGVGRKMTKIAWAKGCGGLVRHDLVSPFDHEDRFGTPNLMQPDFGRRAHFHQYHVLMEGLLDRQQLFLANAATARRSPWFARALCYEQIRIVHRLWSISIAQPCAGPRESRGEPCATTPTDSLSMARKVTGSPPFRRPPVPPRIFSHRVVRIPGNRAQSGLPMTRVRTANPTPLPGRRRPKGNEP